MHPYCRYTSYCNGSDVFCTNDNRVTIFFIVSGLAQLFWVIPTIKRWILPWYYIGIGGTIILIILYFIAVPGSGYPINPLDVAIETFQIVFVILSAMIIFKHRNTAKVNEKNN